MDNQERSLRFGAALIASALLLRLTCSGLLQSVAKFLYQPNIASALIYLETGRHVRFSQSSEEIPAFSSESPLPDFARESSLPVFQAADLEQLQIKYNCSRQPDLNDLISRPLEWDLTGGEPTVLILHTHATESYTRQSGESYEESSAYRTLDEQYNMISIGDRLAELLEAGGIHVIHDRTLHDYPSYSGSYNHARKSAAAYLEAYPSIQLVLDLHRDASGDNRNQMKTRVQTQGKSTAGLMLVVGTNASGLAHPAWEENLSLALKLHVQLDRIAPGIMRYVNLRSQRFNQDLSPGMLLVEVGAAGDSHQDAITAAEFLASAILSLAEGSASG